jgi:ubiquinone biosynthesis protein
VPPRRGLGQLVQAPFRILIRWTRVNGLLFVAVLRWMWVSAGLRLGFRRDDPRPRILRTFLERAGGTWIKLGQILAMRSDFLPPAMIRELSDHLLDNVPPFPYAEARQIIEEDFKRPIEKVFPEFPTHTIAAASFGQVYKAALPSGEQVAVKVLRPGLRTIITADVLQLRFLALIFDTLRLLGSIQLKPQIDQLKAVLDEEIDYGFEAENIRRAVAQSRYFPIMKIPKVYDEFCTSRVLTMEFLSGIWMNEILQAIQQRDAAKLEEWRARGLRLKLVARRMFDIGMRQLFEVGNFHADPHAANIVVLEDNVVGYVDFGIVGQMDQELAESQSQYLEAVKDGRIDDAARALSEVAIIPEGLRSGLPAFRARLANQVRGWIQHVNDRGAELRKKSIGQLLLDNIGLIRDAGFELTANSMRYYRALIIADVTILQLDPEFDTVRSLRRYFQNREVRQLRMKMNAQDITQTVAEYFQLWLDGPRVFRGVARFLRRSEEEFGVVASTFTTLYHGLARASLIGFLIVIAARIAGHPDVSWYIHFPVRLDWRWFAPFLLLCWRVASLATR